MTYVWDLASRTRLSLPDPDGSDIESVAFSPDSKWVATGAANGKTYLWHPPATKPFATLTNPKGPASGSSSGDQGTAVFSVAFSPGGTSLATTGPGRLCLPVEGEDALTRGVPPARPGAGPSPGRGELTRLVHVAPSPASRQRPAGTGYGA